MSLQWSLLNIHAQCSLKHKRPSNYLGMFAKYKILKIWKEEYQHWVASHFLLLLLGWVTMSLHWEWLSGLRVKKQYLVRDWHPLATQPHPRLQWRHRRLSRSNHEAAMSDAQPSSFPTTDTKSFKVGIKFYIFILEQQEQRSTQLVFWRHRKNFTLNVCSWKAPYCGIKMAIKWKLLTV